ncbi:twin-arginine translocase TatA/TatE family subunit [Seleniivibrio woodruffii]|uniref:Sec-independent protein translocase protein TatA n=1 Tax=Seleniivibrio woodruffii TaxID=1078050 RepID=A0A4R1KBI4_9BACT|nr:twin-arginine translocase TatA/TatE family subunit [Seleniivibrio woodruffii]TCK61814.1 sec-independent protein translocase protein TatA [Seleniivibrio woodruffii]TVZ35071.1 sec-independent protein translocase protein TatA [Seleniivibrio woodruffii]
MFGLGSTEIVVILVIALVVFGAGKLPQIGEGMGKAIKNFKKAANEVDTSDVVDITPKSQKKIADDEEKKA